MKWRKQTIGDLVTLQRGHDLTESERKEGIIPVIGAAGQSGYHNVARAKGPGMTIGRSGGSIGKVTYVDQDYWPHNTCLYVTDFKGNHPRFIAYFIGTLNLAQLNSGAAQPSLNRNFVYGVTVACPDAQIQHRIASILSAYDDLIENNRRRVALLEKATRTLYEEWFVRFRFPGHEHVKIVDGVPEGWEQQTLDQLSEYINRGITPVYDDDADSLVINQKCIRNRMLDLSYARQQKKEFKPEKQVCKGDVLINSTGEGTLGRVAQVWFDIPNCTVDTHVTIVRPLPEIERYWFGYSILPLEKLFASMSEGSTNQTELKRQKIGQVSIVTAPMKLRREFDEQVQPIVEQITTLARQNDKLAQARNLLLPKLMSGDIEV